VDQTARVAAVCKSDSIPVFWLKGAPICPSPNLAASAGVVMKFHLHADHHVTERWNQREQENVPPPWRHSDVISDVTLAMESYIIAHLCRAPCSGVRYESRQLRRAGRTRQRRGRCCQITHLSPWFSDIWGYLPPKSSPQKFLLANKTSSA